MTKMNIEVFSDGSELWDDIASGKNKDGAGKFYGKLNNIEKQLVDSKIPFLRIHQSYLVNPHGICRYHPDRVEMENNAVLPISEARQREVKQKYHEFLRRL